MLSASARVGGPGWEEDGFLLTALGYFGVLELEYFLKENELKMRALSVRQTSAIGVVALGYSSSGAEQNNGFSMV